MDSKKVENRKRRGCRVADRNANYVQWLAKMLKLCIPKAFSPNSKIHISTKACTYLRYNEFTRRVIYLPVDNDFKGTRMTIEVLTVSSCEIFAISYVCQRSWKWSRFTNKQNWSWQSCKLDSCVFSTKQATKSLLNFLHQPLSQLSRHFIPSCLKRTPQCPIQFPIPTIIVYKLGRTCVPKFTR